MSNNNQQDDDDDYEEGDVTVCKLQVIQLIDLYIFSSSLLRAGSLQIGMFGDIKKWQERLNRTVNNNDTDDEEGLHNVFRDAVMLVLRNTEYAGYCSSAGKVFGDLDTAERKFNSVLMEERLKFKEETLSNVQGKKKTRALDDEYRGKDVDGLDRWLCMTLLMAIEGKVKIPPKINSTYELKQVLTQLGGLTADDLVAFELLWTPQDESDYYTKAELLEDYPTMITLS